jgi:hypothetical protein
VGLEWEYLLSPASFWSRVKQRVVLTDSSLLTVRRLGDVTMNWDAIYSIREIVGAIATVATRRCNCSMCKRRGAVVASVELKDLNITEGQDALSLYQFNTNTAKHYFCSKCGIYTHHQRRSNPELYAINIACLEGVDPLVLRNVPVLDGEDHPGDSQ